MKTTYDFDSFLEFEDDWLTDELDEAIDDILLFEASSLNLATGFDVITPTEYVAWVQRSLNRLYGSSLVTDGRKTASYRKLVRKFQADYVPPVTGEVDSSTQNQIIKANESNRTYMAWVHKALECDSVFADPPRKKPDSRGSYKSNGLKLGIKIFQKRQGLVRDGWVGSKTEIKLIKCCQCVPPGHQSKTIDAEPIVITGTPCYKQLIKKAIKLLSSMPSRLLFSSKQRRRLGAALIRLLWRRGNDEFIRYGSTSPFFPIRWDKVSNYFKDSCSAQAKRGKIFSDIDLVRRLKKLDQDIINGINEYKRLKTSRKNYGHRKIMFDSKFSFKMKRILKNKYMSIYVRYL